MGYDDHCDDHDRDATNGCVDCIIGNDERLSDRQFIQKHVGETPWDNEEYQMYVRGRLERILTHVPDPEVRSRVEKIEIRPATYVLVLGWKDTAPSDMPRVRLDDGLITELMKWMDKKKIYPIRQLMNGGGRFEAVLTPSDGRRVSAWLRFHRYKT